jgi:hypothetical protein
MKYRRLVCRESTPWAPERVSAGPNRALGVARGDRARRPVDGARLAHELELAPSRGQ